MLPLGRSRLTFQLIHTKHTPRLVGPEWAIGSAPAQSRPTCESNWSFKEARDFARSLKLKSEIEWRAYRKSGKMPNDIPTNPNKVYAEFGWAGMGDWLGTGAIASHLREFRSFEEARDFARSLKLKSGTEWRHYTKSGRKPTDIPTNPNETYAEVGWAGMGDWLGTGTIAHGLREFRSFEEARDFARSLKLKSGTEWRHYTKSGRKPTDIPVDPKQTYAEVGWAGMGDWLGTGAIASFLRKYRSFKEARDFARSLKLKSVAEWLQYCKSGNKPADIPDQPRPKYSGAGWAGMGDWLGTDTIAPHLREYRSFEKGRDFARSLKLKSGIEWLQYCRSGKKPADIPSAPAHVYAHNGWVGMGDWLGTGNVAVFLREYRSFEVARDFARKLGLKSGAEWKRYCKSGKRHVEIPSNPWRSYADAGWAGMDDWLGYVRLGRRSEARSMKGTGEAPAPADASP
jgi:Phage-integrase repeat unit